MLDYDGDFDEFEKELRAAGVTKEECNLENYVGLTYRELRSVVAYAIAVHKRKESNNG